MKSRNNKTFTRKLLEAVAIGGMVVFAASNPYFGLHMISAIQKDLCRKKWKNIYDNIYHLRKRGLVAVQRNSDDTYTVSITGLGKEYIRRYDLDTIEIARPPFWDGQWRLLLYDIPASKQRARSALLGMLKRLNFVMLQESVWAHPYDCQNEISVIADTYKITPYVHYLVTDSESVTISLKKRFEKQAEVSLDH